MKHVQEHCHKMCDFIHVTKCLSVRLLGGCRCMDLSEAKHINNCVDKYDQRTAQQRTTFLFTENLNCCLWHVYSLTFTGFGSNVPDREGDGKVKHHRKQLANWQCILMKLEHLWFLDFLNKTQFVTSKEGSADGSVTGFDRWTAAQPVYNDAEL